MDPLDPRGAALVTDLYEVTMAAAYWEHNLNHRATFELSYRRLPPDRSFIVAAGLDQAIQYLLDLSFDAEQIRWLRSLYAFHNVRPEFWEYLAGLRFTGDVWAPPEGTPMFPGEPLLRVTAPLVEAQIVETYLLSVLSYESTVATSTARLVEAARGKPVIDFGARRAHGPNAGVLAARASYIAGAAGTSSLEAGHQLGIPIHGTMAHAFVMAFDLEEEAFRAYHAVFPDSSVLLLDTYDTERAARLVADLALPSLRGVRLDSGDLDRLSRSVRAILDAAGLTAVKIVASGDLDAARIAELVDAGAPIDSFGVGAALAVSPDAPVLGAVYKLVELESGGQPTPRLKTSPDKASLPGTKQVYRKFAMDGTARRDVLALAGEEQTGAPVLRLTIKDGRMALSRDGVETVRAYTRKAIERLPAELRDPRAAPAPYPVELSPGLEALRDRAAAAAGAG